jgi:hypothetical protein
MAFKDAVECVSRGVCRPAHIVVSKYYVAFIHEGEIRLTREEKFFVEVKVDNSRLITDDWDMFVLRNDGQIISSPRLAVGREIFTTDEFIEYIRKSFQALLSAASWV